MDEVVRFLQHIAAFFRTPPIQRARRAAVADIDTILAAFVDLKPLAEYGVPGTYDTVQARRMRGLVRAERALLRLRRRLVENRALTEERHGAGASCVQEVDRG
jgi:hypothetical protein